MSGKVPFVISGAFGVSLLLLFVGWGTAGKVWKPLTIYFPSFHLLFLAAMLAALLTPVRRTAAALWECLLSHRYLLFPLFAFCSALLIHLFVFGGIPHIQDSIHYRMMADQFAHGRIDLPMHPYYEFFRYLYLIPDGEKIYSLFLPGYSFFLAPFVRMGMGFLANPLLTAAAVTLIGRISEYLFDSRVAAGAMALTVLSPFLIVMGGTAMAHPFCAVMTLLTVYLFLRARGSGTGRRAFVMSASAGFTLGWLLFTRPQNALFLAVPLALVSLCEIHRKGTIARGFALSLAFIPWLIALFFYNAHYTGDPFLFKQDPYFNYSEPNDFCHRFGIGRGCPHSNWTELPTEGLTWRHAAYVTYRRLSPLIVNTFGHPLFFLFVPLPFFFRRDRPWREAFLAALFLSTVVGYFFFYFDGNVFGPRYYYETTPFLMVLASRGIALLRERLSPLQRTHASVPLGGFVAAAYLFTGLFVLPPLFATYAKGFWHVESSLAQVVKNSGLRHAVVFVNDEELIGSGFAVMQHDDWDKNDVIYVRDLGDRSNSALMHYYRGKGRTFYRALFAKKHQNELPPVLIPLGEPELPPSYVIVEMEDKRYPLRGEPDYCNEYPQRLDLEKYTALPPSGAIGVDFSKKAFFCRFRNTDEYYTFGQNLLVEGRYTIQFVGVAGPVMGRFRLFVDDHPLGILDFSGEQYEKAVRTFEVDLKRGFHLFRIEPLDSDSPTYFLLDFIEFFIRDAPPLSIYQEEHL